MACKCYHAERNFVGKIGVCWGTKECEACSCGGDESKCDFYEDVRQRAQKPQTNADRLRAMTDEELALWIVEIAGCNECEEIHGFRMCDNAPGKACEDCWTGWLKSTVKKGE